MRRIVNVLVGLLALAVVVGGSFWVGTAVGDGADDPPGSMMSGTGDPGDGMVADGSGRSGRGGGTGPGSTGTGGTGGMGGAGGMGMAGVMGSATSVDSEADYLAAMLPHHEEAIVAAGELARSERPEMRELGEAVVASQTAQVEQMRSWLERWHPDAEAADRYEPMMRDLSDLSGEELDQAFLVDMLGHHMVAVMMSQQLLMHGDVEHPEVADLARDISDEQRREIVQMRSWLLAWF